MTKETEQKFKKLSEIDHVLLRPGRYIGSISQHTSIENVPTDGKMVQKELVYNPGFLKLFDEIISNSVDHSKRPEGKNLTTIKVDINKDTGWISVFDNGGIPVIKHSEYDQWIPDMIFDLRAGSNFDDSDESMLTGQNGEGAALTKIFSTEFIVETCDGKNFFSHTHKNNGKGKLEPKIKPSTNNHTKISYLPDFDRFSGMMGLDNDNYQYLVNRVHEVAATNPHLKVYLNGSRININSFKDYISMFVDDFVYDENEFWKIGVATAVDGFAHVSFVNGTRTKVGGSHIEFVRMQIANELREFIKKKHKIDLKPNELSQHFQLFIDAQIVNPRYSSQTKEDLITEVKDFKTSWSATDKFIKKIIQSSVVQSVLDWAAAKAHQEELKELRRLNKETEKADPRRVEKFSDAIEKKERHKCILALTEGDSAGKSILAGRGKNPYIASFPLKGKVLNVRDRDTKKILENAEIKKIMTITGLKIGERVNSIHDIRFGKIALTADSDLDGQHIRGLLINFFHYFWPELFDLGVITIFKTPLIKVFRGKETIEFLSEKEFKEWEASQEGKPKNWKMKYYKGLGTSTSKEFGEYLSSLDKYLYNVTIKDINDIKALELAFSGDKADERKDWLTTPAAVFEDLVSEE